jgi:dodecin
MRYTIACSFDDSWLGGMLDHDPATPLHRAVDPLTAERAGLSLTDSGRPARCVVRTPAGDADRMSDHVYKSIEITGSSPDGVTQAIERAVTKASQSLRGLDWFEVTEIRGHIQEGAVAHYQVTLKVGFRLED